MQDLMVASGSRVVANITTALARLAVCAGLFALAETGLAEGFVDNFASLQLLSGYTNYVTGDNTFYTGEPGEPQHVDRTLAHSAWLRWIAPDVGTCVVDTFGSGFDTVLAVYTQYHEDLGFDCWVGRLVKGANAVG